MPPWGFPHILRKIKTMKKLFFFSSAIFCILCPILFYRNTIDEVKKLMSEEKKIKKKQLNVSFSFLLGTFLPHWRNRGPKKVVSVAPEVIVNLCTLIKNVL